MAAQAVLEAFYPAVRSNPACTAAAFTPALADRRRCSSWLRDSDGAATLPPPPARGLAASTRSDRVQPFDCTENSRIWSERDNPAPDVLLSADDGATIALFGVEHGEPQPRIGNFIFTARPSAVVVETAVSPAHGSAPGTPATLSSSPGGDRLRLFAQLAHQLSRASGTERCALWAQLSSGLPGEQLAYVAALALDVPLLFGDRPKGTTYRRLFAHATAADLDEAFARAAWANYHELLAGRPPDAPKPSSLAAVPRRAADGTVRFEGDGPYEVIALREREAVMEYTLRGAAEAAGAGGTVVAVVGRAHVAALRALWRAGGALSETQLAALLHAPDGPAAGDPLELGVRRALLEAAVRLQCDPAVLADLEEELGPVPQDHAEYYGATFELYGTSRALLAALPRERLAAVCSGWRCDMWEVLAPVRAARPAAGGMGYDPGLTLELRTLNLQVVQP